MAETLITPAAPCLFATVLKPRTVRRNDSEKEQYSITLLLDDPDKDANAKAFLGSLHRQFMEKFGGNAKYGPNGRPYKKEVVIEADGTERPTGLVRVMFNRDTMTRSGMELPPPMVQDAKGNSWPKNVAIGNHSIVKVAYSIYCWDNVEGGKGMSLNLLGVRIIEHIPYTPGNVDAGVFGTAEEGVDASQLEPQAESSPFDDEEIPF